MLFDGRHLTPLCSKDCPPPRPSPSRSPSRARWSVSSSSNPHRQSRPRASTSASPPALSSPSPTSPPYSAPCCTWCKACPPTTRTSGSAGRVGLGWPCLPGQHSARRMRSIPPPMHLTVTPPQFNPRPPFPPLDCSHNTPYPVRSPSPTAPPPCHPPPFPRHSPPPPTPPPHRCPLLGGRRQGRAVQLARRRKGNACVHSICRGRRPRWGQSMVDPNLGILLAKARRRQVVVPLFVLYELGPDHLDFVFPLCGLRL